MTPTEPLLGIRDLRVEFGLGASAREVVHGLNLDVMAGEVVALVGESGSGKSVTAMSVLGLLPERTRASGTIMFAGRDLLTLSAAELRQVRGAGIAMVFQDPVASLNPVFTIGFQVIEALRAHAPRMSTADARARAIELLTLVEVPDPERRLRQYPHQLSGGQCQRVGIAMALASDPRLIIADEPTTALDVTVQAEILDLLRRLGRRADCGLLLITHDMGVVADIADRVVVMRHGSRVEDGDVRDLFASPREDYTCELLAAVPRLGERGISTPVPESTTPVLSVRDLRVSYRGKLGTPITAVDTVSFQIERGEILGLVGESGSGKSTIGKAIIGVAPLSAGSITIDGVDLARASGRQRKAVRRRVGVVFQNPTLSLNPRYSVRDTIAEPLAVIRGLRGSELDSRVDRLLQSVRLGGYGDRYPHELSGGQRQRVAIARAVSLDPALLVADEPTSALDVSVQAQVLDVVRELRDRFGFACLFISHDLAVVDGLCDRVAVLHHGTIVEHGNRSSVLANPTHPYTRKLVASAPVPDPDEQQRRRAERHALDAA